MRAVLVTVGVLLATMAPVAPLPSPRSLAAAARRACSRGPPPLSASPTPAADGSIVHSSRRGLLGAGAGGLFGASLWSPLRANAAADAAPDLTGRIALVTGASGLGLESGIELAKMGATVVVGCRDEAKGEAALAKIRAASGRNDCQQLPLDLASFKSVRKCAKTFCSQYQDLHILVHSAGICLPSSAEVAYTEDGFESQMQVNHLGPFLLNGLLLTRLRRAAGGARVVTVANAAHRDAAPMELEADLRVRRKGGRGGGGDDDAVASASVGGAGAAYAKSKLAAVVFTRELQRRLTASGVLATSGGSNGSCGYGDVTTAVWEGGKGNGKGASNAKGLVLLASAPLLVPAGRGGYYDAGGRLASSAMAAVAEDEGFANSLWKASEAATGSPFLLQPASLNSARERNIAPKIQENGAEDVEYFKGDGPGYESTPPFKFH